MTLAEISGFVRFSIRCAISAMLSFAIGDSFDPNHAVWAAISALVVAKENLPETQKSVAGRMTGTLFGALVAVLVYQLGHYLHWPATAILGVAIIITALVAKARPSIRVCMWTSAMVLLTASPNVSIPMTALYRSSEVLLGIFISMLLHMLDHALFITPDQPNENNSEM